MKRPSSVALFGLLALAVEGCTAVTAGPLVAPRCDDDAACERANEALGLGPEVCTRYRCERTSGSCRLLPRDEDRDGVVARACGGDDCDDGAPDTYGGASPAPERCDGRDTNCNGRLDGDGEDDDGDGHADNACAGASGSDCNDADPAVYVGATELCDGRDNDCSSGGAIDGTEDRSCPAGAGWECRAGRCEDTRCAAGVLNCDRDEANGCEVDPSASLEHCGRCGFACTGAGAVCVRGRCDAVTQVVVGEGLACALRSGGAVACWGDAIDATPNDDFVEGSSVPRVMPWAQGARSLFAGRRACAIEAAGSVLCWGGRVERDSLDETTPGRFDRLSRIALTGEPRALVSATALLVADTGGAVRVRSYLDGSEQGTVAGASDVVSLAGSLGVFSHTCVASRDGAVRCWGSNDHGELGVGGEGSRDAVPVPGLTSVVEVAVGLLHSCARRSDGAVYCWGSNEFGQVTPNAALRGRDLGAPVPVALPLGSAVEIAAGGSTTCVRTGAGRVFCWGARAGVPTEAFQPLAGIDDATQLSVGSDEACALRANGVVWCWGGRAAGVGADVSFSPLPRPVAGL